MKLEEKSEGPRNGELVRFDRYIDNPKVSKILDYLIGFLTGMIFNVLSFYILERFRFKQEKRVGMFWGCLASFIFLFSFSIVFSSYSSYLLKERNQRMLFPDDNRKLRGLLSFREFIQMSLDKKNNPKYLLDSEKISIKNSTYKPNKRISKAKKIKSNIGNTLKSKRKSSKIKNKPMGYLKKMTTNHEKLLRSVNKQTKTLNLV